MTGIFNQDDESKEPKGALPLRGVEPLFGRRTQTLLASIGVLLALIIIECILFQGVYSGGFG